MSFERAALVSAVQTHGVVTRILVAGHKGSVPRDTGTAMLVWAGGQSGTIGGGALEHDAVQTARRAPDGHSITRPLGPALGQCCGGAVTLVFETFRAEDLGRIPDAGVFARPLSGSGPEPLSVRRARAAARRGQAPSVPVLEDGWLIETLSPPRRPLWIYGAGHVGRAIAATMAPLPFDVVLIDDAETRFPETLPEGVTRLVAAHPVDAVAHAPAEARHLVVTYSHALDLALCHAILSRAFCSLGLIGSATKRARFLRRLAALGHAQAQIARLECPIGDPALGKHPQAIAVSVAHRLLMEDAASAAATTRRTRGKEA